MILAIDFITSSTNEWMNEWMDATTNHICCSSWFIWTESRSTPSANVWKNHQKAFSCAFPTVSTSHGRRTLSVVLVYSTRDIGEKASFCLFVLRKYISVSMSIFFWVYANLYINMTLIYLYVMWKKHDWNIQFFGQITCARIEMKLSLFASIVLETAYNYCKSGDTEEICE